MLSANSINEIMKVDSIKVLPEGIYLRTSYGNCPNKLFIRTGPYFYMCSCVWDTRMGWRDLRTRQDIRQAWHIIMEKVMRLD